jgi:RHS repeat-associated protein
MVAFNKTYRKTLTPSSTHRDLHRKPHTPDRSAKDSGLRFYSAEISRWLSRDPIGELDSVNTYSLVNNQPVLMSDFLGLWGQVRRDSTKRWATVCSDKTTDSWPNLAPIVKLEESEADVWVRNYDPTPVLGKWYDVPNTVLVSAGGQLVDQVSVELWDLAAERIPELVNHYEGLNYHVLADNNFAANLSHRYLQAFVYVGHGLYRPRDLSLWQQFRRVDNRAWTGTIRSATGRAELGPVNMMAAGLLSHKLAFVWAFGCHTAVASWENMVSSYGTAYLYSGSPTLGGDDPLELPDVARSPGDAPSPGPPTTGVIPATVAGGYFTYGGF